MREEEEKCVGEMKGGGRRKRGREKKEGGRGADLPPRYFALRITCEPSIPVASTILAEAA